MIGSLNCGWALWNLRGSNGIVDTNRPGTPVQGLAWAQAGFHVVGDSAIEDVALNWRTRVPHRAKLQSSRNGKWLLP